MAIKLGKPTEYGYRLPAIRFRLCAQAIESIPASAHMLDYGCGNGANTVLFKDHLERVEGIDVEATRVQEGSAYLTSNGIKNIDCSPAGVTEYTLDSLLFERLDD